VNERDGSSWHPESRHQVLDFQVKALGDLVRVITRWNCSICTAGRQYQDESGYNDKVDQFACKSRDRFLSPLLLAGMDDFPASIEPNLFVSVCKLESHS
jgi:hypothetical protein